MTSWESLMQILCFSSNVNIAFRLCVINQSESSFREFKARSFRVHRGKRGTIRRNSSRLAFLTRFCLARVRLEPPTKFVRLPLLRLFVPRHFFLFFFFSIVPSLLSLSHSLLPSFFHPKRVHVCVPYGAASWLGFKIIREKAAKGSDRSCVLGEVRWQRDRFESLNFLRFFLRIFLSFFIRAGVLC